MVLNRARHVSDLWGFHSRNGRRVKKWVTEYKKYLAGDLQDPPFPSVVQLIPTERCNLRCKMCNQWGENGYFITGKREPTSMPAVSLRKFLDRFAELSSDYLLSIHGGEPFMYREMGALLDYASEKKLDLFFSTNGTLLGPHLERLAKVNRHTFYLLSIDGGHEANDRIRGKGTTEKIIKNIRALRAKCAEMGTGLPKILVNYCVNEHNPDDIDSIGRVAKEVGALAVNYNLRWFMPERSGLAYNEMLQSEFNVKPTNAWTGWMTHHPFDRIDGAIDRIYDKRRNRALVPVSPYYAMLPKGLTRDQAKAFYNNYDETFGIKSCIMPSYWARVHASGELIYCPGHPDIVPGNVFTEDFRDIFLNKISTQLRRRVEKNLMPICNRCCGLYMTYPATRMLGKGFVPQS